MSWEKIVIYKKGRWKGKHSYIKEVCSKEFFQITYCLWPTKILNE